MKTSGGDAHITSIKWMRSKYVFNSELNALKYFHVLFCCHFYIVELESAWVCDFAIVKLADDAFYPLVAAQTTIIL